MARCRYRRMPIATTNQTLVQHLRERLRDGGLLEGWAVEALTLPEARTRPGHGISLVLWRVQPDEPSGDVDHQRSASQAEPPEGVGLKLRYLLLVRGGEGADEQRMLGRCMAVLDQHPVVAAPDGLGAGALVVSVEAPSDEAYLRLVQACGDPPPLVVPYAVRSVQLRPPSAGALP
jgi:hypothetical protein